MSFEVMREDFYRAYRDRLEQLIKIPLVATNQDIHNLIEDGFSADRIRVLCERGTLSKLLREQIIPLEILERRLLHDQKLTLQESDHLFRVVHIISMAEVVFGCDIKARRWLLKSKASLLGKSPNSMLTTTQGAYEVEKLLIKVAEAYAL